MKISNVYIYCLIFIFCFSFSTFSQTEKNKSSTKIGLINRKYFDGKTNGIKEVTEAYDKLELEFKSQNDKLKTLEEELKKLGEAIIKTNKDAQIFDPPFEKLEEYRKEFEKSVNEYERLVCKYKSEKQRAKNEFKKRESEILKEANIKIAEALKQFGKQNGFAIILESSVDNSPIIIDGEVIDITQDFIKFYNENFVVIKTQ